MKRAGTTLLAATLLTGACAAGRADRPPADPEAMREAAQGARTIDRYASSRAYLHYLNARMHEATGDHDAALEELKLAVVYDDEAAELRLALGWLYARLDVLDKAEAEARRAERLDPRSHGAKLLLGKLHAARGRRAEAAAALEQAIGLAPSEEEAYLSLVRLHAEAGELAKAEKVAARLAKVQPNEAEAYRLLARAAVDRRDAAAEERHLREAVARDPWDFASLLKLAALAEAKADRGRAEAAYEAILRRDPDHAEALLGAARLALGRDDEAAARAYLSQLLAGAGEGRDVRLRAALAWFAARHYEEALLLLDEAERQRPGDPRTAYYRGLVFEGQRRYADAAAAYLSVPRSSRELGGQARVRAANALSLAARHDEATRLLEGLVLARERGADAFAFVPDVFRRAGRVADGVRLLERAGGDRTSPDLAVPLARALHDGGRDAEAEALLRGVLEKAPVEERATFALAAILERRGDVDGAVALMRRLLAADPENASALNFIGYVWADRGVRLDEAKALLDQALALRPDEGAFLDSMGWLLLRRGDARGAVTWLERALAQSPGEPEILDHLAEAYDRAGRKADALEAWTQALEALGRDPDPRVRASVEAKLKRARAGSALRRPPPGR